MLSELSIRNFATIKEAELIFDNGLNVIVGETGAGKSLLLGAVGFLRGDRVKLPISNGTVVEAVFERDGEEIIVRREIVNGRTRFFLNGRRVPQQLVKENIAPLITIQSQHESITLLKPSRQLKIVDQFAGNSDLLEEYRAAYTLFLKAKGRLEILKESMAEKKRKIDVLKFQINELESVEWGEEIENELSRLVDILSKAEKIKEVMALSRAELYEGEDSAHSKIGRVLREIEELDVEDLIEELSDIHYRIEGFVFELEKRLSIPETESSLEEIEDRLYEMRKLKEKYGPSWGDVRVFYERAKAELEELENIDFKIESAEKSYLEAKEKVERLAEELSKSRRKAAGRLERRIKEHLKELELKNARFKIEFEAVPLSSTGKDRVSFLFTGNPAMPLQPVDVSISGGELSRLLLSILAEGGKASDVLVFDEIDAGMSGKVLSRVAEKLLKISRNVQIIAVSHSPAVVAMADTVFKVEKSPKGEIAVFPLEKGDVEREIARMIAGEMTEGSLQAARELMDRKGELG
ncbi:DNA repair protein RecN [Desulfurobacterium sp.]|uniref:DNA repair protein RecN n=1 Tax=Desulfurobacterium sp. TaxID=2004706 RepID=UPI002638714E|nr:DNA repair protein RecN [Desulfurobacterium sp.]